MTKPIILWTIWTALVFLLVVLVYFALFLSPSARMHAAFDLFLPAFFIGAITNLLFRDGKTLAATCITFLVASLAVEPEAYLLALFGTIVLSVASFAIISWRKLIETT